jgi:hypothetical protein
MSTTTSNTLAKIPTKWLPQVLDDIIDQKREWIQYEKDNQDDDFSICEFIKRTCNDKDSYISFNHMEEELWFSDIYIWLTSINIYSALRHGRMLRGHKLIFHNHIPGMTLFQPKL